MGDDSSNSFSLVSLGKPIEKLIDSVSKAVGIVYKPRAIRNEADAEAYRIEKIANAKAKSSIIKSDADNEIAERARKRLYHREMQRQINIDNVVDKSVKYLQQTVSEQPVDEDWMTRFFNRVQDIGNDDVAEIWSKILANEINRPGCFSVRTIDVLSNLSRVEAELFRILLSCKFESENSLSVLKPSLHNDLNTLGLSTDEILNLANAGLIYSDNNLYIEGDETTLEHDGRTISGTHFQFGEKKYFLHAVTSIKVVGMNGFPAIPFTQVGRELANIISVEPKYEYWEKFKAYWISFGIGFIEI